MMLTKEIINSIAKEDLESLVPTLNAADIQQLVEWLSEKEDNFRYKCFLLLQSRSQLCADVYLHWQTLLEKLNNANSYQRSIGLMLLAENVRWDIEGRFETILNLYLAACDDEKPITVRQCIQSLGKVVPCQPGCHAKITDKLLSIDLMQRKETQRKLLLMDILAVLAAIHRMKPDERIERYSQQALTGGLLDEKSKRLVAAL
jgi:hypothetical protein